MSPLKLVAAALFLTIIVAVWMTPTRRPGQATAVTAPDRALVTSVPRCVRGDCHVTVEGSSSAVWLTPGAYFLPGEEIDFTTDARTGSRVQK
jgi:hypothetical protein